MYKALFKRTFSKTPPYTEKRLRLSIKNKGTYVTVELCPKLSKPTCFTNSTPRSFISFSRTAFTDYCPDRFF